MKAVILAAGVGSRLRPLTNQVPKCMVKVGDVSIIKKQIDNLRENGINDITIIGGYKFDVLAKYINDNYEGIRLINNTDYNTTNNMYSFYMSKEFVINQDFLLLNGDVYFSSSIIKQLIDDEFPNLIATDKSMYNEESMKVVINNDRIKKIGKQISKEEFSSVSIDVYKIGKKASNKFFEIVKSYVVDSKNINAWTEVALNDLFKFEKFKESVINGSWVEIDDQNDLEKASQIWVK